MKTVTETVRPDNISPSDWERIRVKSSHAQLKAMGAIREYTVEEPHDPNAEDRKRLEFLQSVARYGSMTIQERQEFDHCNSVGGVPLTESEISEKNALMTEQDSLNAKGEHLPAFCAKCNKEHAVPHGEMVAPGIVINSGLENGKPFCPGCDEWSEPLKQMRLNHLTGRPTPKQAARLDELKKKRRSFTPEEAAEHQTLKARLEA
jgi:MoaA/NifB/PqqE/SkfB family radical SAM enzyme